MDPAGGTSAPNSTNLNTDSTAGVKAPEGMDLSAINEAIAASAEEAVKTEQQTFDVNDISLDNTPTTDAALEQQKASDPNMSLANSGAATSATAAPAAAAEPAAPAAPAAETAATEEKPAAPAAAFVDGDIVDESPKEEEAAAPAPEPNYDALNADPLASFDESSAATATPAEAPAEGASAEGEAKKEDDKKDEKDKKAKKDIKINIDFNAILHSNIAIIGIVVGVIIIAVVAILIFTLNG